MLRPMVATTAVTAALILVAGCGGDDKKSDSGSENNGGQSTSSTPSAPAAPSFDPPKAFALGAAFPVIKDPKHYSYSGPRMAIVGKVAVVGTVVGLVGHDVTNQSKTWTVKAAPAETTTVNTALAPKAVKVDGKDVAVVAYSETDKGNGTQKPTGLVVVQWIDVESGDKIAETSTKIEAAVAGNTPTLGTAAYDVESGQIAVGVTSPGNSTVTSRDLTVFADPATKKATIVPGISPAAVHGGTIAGAKSAKGDRTDDAVMVLADGPSGKVTKQLAPLQTMFKPLAGTSKHGYFYGMKYTDYDAGKEANAIYAVDLSTGAVVPTALPEPTTSSGSWTCFPDEATSVACVEQAVSKKPDTIIGLDDATGKKTWGFSNDSGDRNVPEVTAAFHGVLYAQTEAQPVLMDAKTGQDLPSAAPTSPGSTDSPSDGGSPSEGSTPSDSDSPSGAATPSDGDSPGNGDLGLFNGSIGSPESVSPSGGVYSQQPSGGASVTSELDAVCIYLKPTA